MAGMVFWYREGSWMLVSSSGFLVGWRLFGTHMLISSLVAMAISSLMLDALALLVDFPPMEDTLMACIAGGVLLGLSLGITFSRFLKCVDLVASKPLAQDFVSRGDDHKGVGVHPADEACLEVATQDPLGAYCVDYIRHETARVVSYDQDRKSVV